MKSTVQIAGIFLLALLFSCEGPAGPPGLDGRDGLDGLDGLNILGQVYEVEGDFNSSNNYSLLSTFPQTIEVFESDVVLVFLLWDQTEDGNGDPVDIWRLLPQTRLIDQGILQYNYDHTFLDVNIFLEADFDLATLQPGDTENQVFRIAVMPADFADAANIDTANLSQVMGSLNISEQEVQHMSVD